MIRGVAHWRLPTPEEQRLHQSRVIERRRLKIDAGLREGDAVVVDMPQRSRISMGGHRPHDR